MRGHQIKTLINFYREWTDLNSTRTKATPSSASALVTLSPLRRKCFLLAQERDEWKKVEKIRHILPQSRTTHSREIIIADRLNNEAIFLHICSDSRRKRAFVVTRCELRDGQPRETLKPESSADLTKHQKNSTTHNNNNSNKKNQETVKPMMKSRRLDRKNTFAWDDRTSRSATCVSI